jgi:hypothetical protein
MSKLAEFFQEDNGSFSATRLAFLAWIFGVLIGWGIDTVHHDYKMADIPQSVQVLIGVLMTGKVAQKFREEQPNTDTTRVQIIGETQRSATNVEGNNVMTQQGR